LTDRKQRVWTAARRRLVSRSWDVPLTAADAAADADGVAEQLTAAMTRCVTSASPS